MLFSPELSKLRRAQLDVTQNAAERMASYAWTPYQTGAFAAHVGAFAFLAVFGWLSGLILAKLYKIVAFLTWLETYGPVMGRARPLAFKSLFRWRGHRSGS